MYVYMWLSSRCRRSPTLPVAPKIKHRLKYMMNVCLYVAFFSLSSITDSTSRT